MFDVLYSFILMYEFDGAFQLEASFLVLAACCVEMMIFLILIKAM